MDWNFLLEKIKLQFHRILMECQNSINKHASDIQKNFDAKLYFKSKSFKIHLTATLIFLALLNLFTRNFVGSGGLSSGVISEIEQRVRLLTEMRNEVLDELRRITRSECEVSTSVDGKRSSKCVKLSLLLTQIVRKLGQESCNLSSIDVSVNGGWCANISGKNSTEHVFDADLAVDIGVFLAGYEHLYSRIYF